jgi:hypothetical protein
MDIEELKRRIFRDMKRGFLDEEVLGEYIDIAVIIGEKAQLQKQLDKLNNK